MSTGIDRSHARRFTDAQLNVLWAGIETNDIVSDVEIPRICPRLDYDHTLLADGFAISRELWRSGFDRDALLDLVATIARDGRLDTPGQLRFKHIRAKFKHLRFAFVLYGVDHRCPTMFKAVTTLMGHLQDAFKGERTEASRRHARILRLLLAGVPHLVLRREVDRLTPCAPADYRDFVLTQIATLRAMVEAPAMTGHGFHAARKIVSRQVSFHDDMRAITGDAEHQIMAPFLAAINGMMGKAHDDLVHARAGGGAYSRAQVVLAPDLQQRLSALIDLYS